jgi:hypothetical protein
MLPRKRKLQRRPVLPVNVHADIGVRASLKPKHKHGLSLVNDGERLSPICFGN